MLFLICVVLGCWLWLSGGFSTSNLLAQFIPPPGLAPGSQDQLLFVTKAAGCQINPDRHGRIAFGTAPFDNWRAVVCDNFGTDPLRPP